MGIYHKKGPVEDGKMSYDDGFLMTAGQDVKHVCQKEGPTEGGICHKEGPVENGRIPYDGRPRCKTCMS